MNYGAGPSRPPPIPYDDPYSDSFSTPAGGDGEYSTSFNGIRNDTGRHESVRPGPIGSVGSNNNNARSVHMNGGAPSPGPQDRNTRGRGRGGGRNRQSDRGRRGRGKGAPQHPQRRHPSFTRRSSSHEHSPNLTPPSSFGQTYSQQPDYGGAIGEWSHGAPPMTQQPPAFGLGLQNNFLGVQPHINPRFANQLGFNFSQVSQIPQISPGAGSPSSSEQYHPGDVNMWSTTGHHQWEEGSG